jgi:phage protein D
MARFPAYAPEFRAEIDGDAIPAALRGCISRITHTDGIQGADRVEITLSNQDLRWLDHPLLQVDNPLTLSLGYSPDPLEKVFTGEITGITATFPGGGMPTLTIVAHDFLHRLTTGTRNRNFALDIPTIGQFPLPDPLVVGLVSAADLLIPEPDPVGAALSFFMLLMAYAISPAEAKNGIRKQDRQSDFDFLTTVAKENGWEFFIDHTREPQGSVLRFQFPLSELEPSVELAWGRSLLDFTPRLTTVGQVAAVQTRIWVPGIQTELAIVLGWDFDRAAFDLQIFPGLGKAPLKEPEKVFTIPGTGAAVAPKALLSTLLPRLNNRLTGSGSAVGNLAIKAGRVISLGGLGAQFSGLHRITSATHTIDGGGFRTRFETRKEVWFGAIPVPRGVGGLARVNGQRIG